MGLLRISWSDSTIRTVGEVADNLGTDRDSLYRWRREHRAKQSGAFPGHGKEALTDQENHIRALEKKLKDVEMERDILKKAMAIFSGASK